MFKVKPFFPKLALLKIYYAIIHPSILYVLLTWKFTYPTYTSQLCTLQNKEIKRICSIVVANSQTTLHPITLN